jgi:hypothetical protein
MSAKGRRLRDGHAFLRRMLRREDSPGFAMILITDTVAAAIAGPGSLTLTVAPYPKNGTAKKMPRAKTKYTGRVKYLIDYLVRNTSCIIFDHNFSIFCCNSNSGIFYMFLK